MKRSNTSEKGAGMASTAVLARLQRSAGWRPLIALFAVPAILIGLLAMHVLTTTDMSHSTASTTMTAHHLSAEALASGEALTAISAVPAPSEDCGGLCGPSHDMLALVCVLALLVTVMLLTVHLVLIRWEERRPPVTTLSAKAATLARPRPPSLHVLSISRT